MPFGTADNESAARSSLRFSGVGIKSRRGRQIHPRLLPTVASALPQSSVGIVPILLRSQGIVETASMIPATLFSAFDLVCLVILFFSPAGATPLILMCGAASLLSCSPSWSWHPGLSPGHTVLNGPTWPLDFLVDDAIVFLGLPFRRMETGLLASSRPAIRQGNQLHDSRHYHSLAADSSLWSL